MSNRSSSLAFSRRLRQVFCVLFTQCSVLSPHACQAAEGTAAVRGILVSAERVTPDLLAVWKARRATAVVVPLDGSLARDRWAALAKSVAGAGLALYPWIEVARNPALADAHPEWMVSVAGHHNDWRRRFPNAPSPERGQVIKVWPWVPIGYAPAFEAHRARVRRLLDDLPGPWAGVFLNDLQAAPSSCGCGNDQCRWALDYGSPATAPLTPGDDAAARLVAEVQNAHAGKLVIPVWVTECETVDLAESEGSTGLCGGVGCARGSCWPRYVLAWNPLLKATSGPVAWAGWSETFQRDPERWLETGLTLFKRPPRGGSTLPADRTIAVLQGWKKADSACVSLIERAQRISPAWVISLDPLEQSWEPRVVSIEEKEAHKR